MPERDAACDEWRDDLAGWLVAQLSPERERRLEAHLSQCVACRVESASLLVVSAVALGADPHAPVELIEDSAPVSATVPPARPVELHELPDGLEDRIGAAIVAERRVALRRRAGIAVLAGVAAAVVVLVATGVVRRDASEPTLRGETVAFSVVPRGATAGAVVADDPAGGSIVQLTAAGLDPQLTYALWLSPPSGGWEDRVPAGTFRPEPDGSVDVRLRCALPSTERQRVWATTPDGAIALDTE